MSQLQNLDTSAQVQRKNSTPRTDSCPHCGAEPWDSGDTGYKCASDLIQDDTDFAILYRSAFCYGNENSQLKRKLVELEGELELMKTAGIIEVAVRNPSVKDYMEHWEERAEKAEAEVERLKDELKKGARILATIVTALQDAVPWIKSTLNPETK